MRRKERVSKTKTYPSYGIRTIFKTLLYKYTVSKEPTFLTFYKRKINLTFFTDIITVHKSISTLFNVMKYCLEYLTRWPKLKYKRNYIYQPMATILCIFNNSAARRYQVWLSYLWHYCIYCTRRYYNF